ncbi:MAG: hypothetical protein A2542_01215 [Parcubacteria group bacterium RIFOXYD2_FULL_52_8]|nr:MAG: hypothetical protein A2542_01215 [Parcubacteria group bacterium RIFOXYD2_FULL_52_8]
MDNVKITTTDGFTLDADYYPGTSNRGIVFAHGAGSHKDETTLDNRIALELQSDGFHSLVFDFRGHGKSSGSSIHDFLIAGELCDLTAAVAYIRSRGVARLGLAGGSLGGTIAALYAGGHPEEVEALVLGNPVLSYHTCFFEPTTRASAIFFAQVHRVLAKHESFTFPWNGFKVGRAIFDEMREKGREYDPVDALHRYPGPLLIMHGDEDAAVAHADSEKHFARLPHTHKRFVTIHGGDHAFKTEPHQTEVVKITSSFFREVMPA